MKTIFDPAIKTEIISRINTLSENSQAQWGKMTLDQMLKHCRLWEEMMLGKTKYKQVFIGRLLGQRILRSVLKDEKPMGRNAPTVPAFKIKDHADVLSEKKKWIALIEEAKPFPYPDITHPFFGKMTKEQVGFLAYKHIDHHLRQFNA